MTTDFKDKAMNESNSLKWGGMSVKISEFGVGRVFDTLPDHTAHLSFDREKDDCGHSRPSIFQTDKQLGIEIPFIDCTLGEDGFYSGGTGYNHKLVSFFLKDLMDIEIASNPCTDEKLEIVVYMEAAINDLLSHLGRKRDELESALKIETS